MPRDSKGNKTYKHVNKHEISDPLIGSLTGQAMSSFPPPETTSSADPKEPELDFWDVIRSGGPAQRSNPPLKAIHTQFSEGSKVTFEAMGTSEGSQSTEQSAQKLDRKNTGGGPPNIEPTQLPESGQEVGEKLYDIQPYTSPRPAPMVPHVRRNVQPEEQTERIPVSASGEPSTERLQPSAAYVPGRRFRNYAAPFTKEARAKRGAIKEESDLGGLKKGMMSAPSLPVTFPGPHVIDGADAYPLTSREHTEAGSSISKPDSHVGNVPSPSFDTSFDHTKMTQSPDQFSSSKRDSFPGLPSSPSGRNEHQSETSEAEGSKHLVVPPRSSSKLERIAHKFTGIRRSKSQNIESLYASTSAEHNDEPSLSSGTRNLSKSSDALSTVGPSSGSTNVNDEGMTTDQIAESRHIKGKGKIVHPHLAGHGPTEITDKSTSKVTDMSAQAVIKPVTTVASSKGKTVCSTLRHEPGITFNPDLLHAPEHEDNERNQLLPAPVYYQYGIGDNAPGAPGPASMMADDRLNLHMSEHWKSRLRVAMVEDMWKNIPEERKRAVKHLDIDVFVPGVMSEPKHGDVPHSFALRPVSEFRNLRSLRVHMMLDSYQEEIWTAAWGMPNLEELTMEMILEPEVDALGNGFWRRIDLEWSPTDGSRYVNLYHGNKKGCLHDSIGYGEYLDYTSVLKGKLNAQRQGIATGGHDKLSIRKLSLVGFAVHGKPIVEFFDPAKFKEIHLISKCIDGGLSLNGTQFSDVVITSPAIQHGRLTTISRIPRNAVRLVTLRGGKEVKSSGLPKHIEENEVQAAQAAVQQAAQTSSQGAQEPSPEPPKAKKEKKAKGKKK